MSQPVRFVLVATFDPTFDLVVLVRKEKPPWQAGKANFPGGKVEEADFIGLQGDLSTDLDAAYLRAAARKLREETGLDVSCDQLRHVATLDLYSGNQGVLFACVADVFEARKTGTEEVFFSLYSSVVEGFPMFWHEDESIPFEQQDHEILPTVYNLPWLVVMARECLLRGSPGFPVRVTELVPTPGPGK